MTLITTGAMIGELTTPFPVFIFGWLCSVSNSGMLSVSPYIWLNLMCAFTT